MARWKDSATEYTVKVNICGNRGYQSTIPMPLMNLLGRPAQITFHVRGGEIVVTSGSDAAQGLPRRGRKRRA